MSRRTVLLGLGRLYVICALALALMGFVAGLIVGAEGEDLGILIAVVALLGGLILAALNLLPLGLLLIVRRACLRRGWAWTRGHQVLVAMALWTALGLDLNFLAGLADGQLAEAGLPFYAVLFAGLGLAFGLRLDVLPSAPPALPAAAPATAEPNPGQDGLDR